MEQSKEKTVRSSNIELLRIILILGVIILHYNHAEGGGAFLYVEKGSINFYFLNFLESICISAVNLFILISGYYLCMKQNRNFVKPVGLVLQVVLFLLLNYFVNVISGDISFSIKGFIRAILPCNYFVILYITLYFVSPFINIMLLHLTIRQRDLLQMVLIIAFSVWPTAVDFLEALETTELMGLSSVGMYGSQYGYTIVNFVLMYIIGANLRAKENAYSILKLLLSMGIVSITLTVWAQLSQRVAWSYCNPLVVLQAVIIFLIFNQLKIKKNKIINNLAKGVFTVFLAHGYFWPLFCIEEFVGKTPFMLGIHIVCTCLVIYLMCYVVYLIYSYSIGIVYVKFMRRFNFTGEIDLENI